jgi:Uma2 family endonuclease
VIEILSPGTRRRDLGIKRELFERGGVREYWVVDPKADAVAVYRRGESGRLISIGQLRAEEGAMLTTPLLPGFELPLAKLFGPLLPDRG